MDLCLVGEAITYVDRLQVMHAIDDLLLPCSCEGSAGKCHQLVLDQ